MKVCIAEKPSVAKEIATILKATSRRDGYFEGNGYQVTWTFGHLCTLKTPDDYTQQWKWWRLDTLPMIPPKFGIKLITNDGVEKQFNTIKTLVDKCDEVVNCGDAGIEGELIQRWVLAKAGCKKPVKRLWISSLTEEAIREGFNNLKDADDYNLLYAAGNARAIGDWLLGMNASRLYTLKYANNKGVLSIGRVQTPTLAIVVNRFYEIENFVPTKYWEIKTKYKDVLFNSTKGRFKSAEDANIVLEKIKEAPFTITSYSKKKGKEAPPKLFDLTALQVECNKKLGYTAEETLKYIQSLYEKKLVTYPRVDTTFLPNDMYPKISGVLSKLSHYKEFVEPLLKEKIKKSKKVFDDKKVTDHHAIIPTGVVPGGLRQEEMRVYDTITRRFIAAFSPDCIVSNTTVMGKVNEYEFKATGKVIVEDGWRILYPKRENSSDDGSGQIMPQFEKGESGPHEPSLLEKQTQPPKLHTEATLLRAMETAGKSVDDEELSDAMKENGIGRPSTRANIIETLFKRKYIKRQKKNILPTQTGVDLIKTIKNDLLKSVELTGMWERNLRLIEKGEYDAKTFVDEMKKMIYDLVVEVKRDNSRGITFEEEEASKTKKSGKKQNSNSKDKDITCPKCNEGKILKGKTAFGCSRFKEGCNFRIDFTQYGKKLTDKQVSTLISKRKSGKISGFVIDNEKQTGVLKLTDTFTIEFEAAKNKKSNDIKAGDRCPKCGEGSILKGKTAYGCSRFREGCDFRTPFGEQ